MLTLSDDHLRDLADRLEIHARASAATKEHCQDCDDAAQGIRQLMQQRDSAAAAGLVTKGR